MLNFLFFVVSKLLAKAKSQAPQDAILVIALVSSLTQTHQFLASWGTDLGEGEPNLPFG